MYVIEDLNDKKLMESFRKKNAKNPIKWSLKLKK